MNVSFRPLSLADVPLLTGWLQQPHVRAFWDDGERDEQAVRAHYFRAERKVPGFVFCVEGRAVGFVQTERVTAAHEFQAFAAQTGETWALDLLIGEQAWTGRGLGAVVITAFVAALGATRPALTRVLIDPEVRNGRAVRAYTKAGFVPLGRVDGWQLMGLEVQPGHNCEEPHGTPGPLDIKFR